LYLTKRGARAIMAALEQIIGGRHGEVHARQLQDLPVGAALGPFTRGLRANRRHVWLELFESFINIPETLILAVIVLILQIFTDSRVLEALRYIIRENLASCFKVD
jgi:hypothetical protein